LRLLKLVEPSVILNHQRHELGHDRTLFMHLTHLPYLNTAGELKTKPTQHSVKQLLSLGIQADVLVCRADREIPKAELNKIALFTNVPSGHVISCPDSDSIYRVPQTLYQNGLDQAVLDHFRLGGVEPNLSDWEQFAELYVNPPRQARIAMVGKYTQLSDAYKSLNEALIHGGLAQESGVEIVFVDAESLENASDERVQEAFSDIGGILVPGGFGVRGTEGKMRAIQYAREHNVPYFGICLGMQLAVVEFARHQAGLSGAGSTEFAAELGELTHPVIGLMTEWAKEGAKELRSAQGNLGGTMRLGGYPCTLTAGSKAGELYGSAEIRERHRHRYEFNPAYKGKLEQAGLTFSGWSPDGNLAEVIELPNHPWFIAVQFHPEFNSRPQAPHPLFKGFIRAALAKQLALQGQKKAA